MRKLNNCSRCLSGRIAERHRGLAVLIIAVLLFELIMIPSGSFALDEDGIKAGSDERALTVSEKDYSITVTLDKREKLDESTFDLSADEIRKGSDEFYKYLAKAEKSLNDAGSQVASARFFDIEILKDGKKYEPKYPAEVSIKYDKAMEQEAEDELSIVHFAKDGTEVIDDVSVAKGGKELTYKQDSFSVTGTVVARNNIQDGKQYVVYVASGDSYYAITHYSLANNDDTVYGAEISGSTTTGAEISSDSVGSSIVWTVHRVEAAGRSWYTLSFEEGGKTYYLRSYGGLMVGADSDIDADAYRDASRYQWDYDNEGRLRNRQSGNQAGRYLRYSVSGGAFKERDSNDSSRFYFAEVSEYTQDEVKTPKIHYVDEAGNDLTVVNGRDWSEDTSTSPAYLIYDIDRYEYVKTTMGENFGSASEIKPIIRKLGSIWQYTTSGGTSITWNTIPDNDDIYVVYKTATEPVSGGTPKPKESSSTQPPVDPTIHKGSVSNGDGTNTLSLSITADTSPLEVEKLADVIVIFDTSTSMRRYMGTSTQTYNNNETPASQCDHNTRLYIAAQAVNGLADMLIGDNTEFKDSAGNKLIRMSLISFDEDARLKQDFTDNYSSFSNSVNNLTTYTGTNWEAALEMANNLEVESDRATFIIFVTDGNPSYRVQRGNTLTFDGYPETVDDAHVDVYSNNNYYYYRSTDNFGALSETDVRNYYTATQDARSIVEHNKNLYSIGIGNSAGITRLQSLTSYAYDNEQTGADRTKTADNETELMQAFKDITASIVALLGWGDINMTDGITSLANTVEKSGLVNVEGDFEYWKAPAPEGWSNMTKEQRAALINDPNNPYVPDDSKFVRWNPASENCEPATYDESSGSVKWNMGHNFVPESGATYKVTFRVWPSQQAYDILANLKNGTMTYSELSQTYRDQILDLGNGNYSLKTNDKEPSTTYKAARKTGDGVETTGDEKTLLFNTVEPMALVPEKMYVKKEWDHSINESHMVDALKFRLKVDGLYYQNDGSFEAGTEDAKILDITEAERIISGETIPAWSNRINVAPGLIKYVQGDNGEVAEIYETGHKYQLEEYDISMEGHAATQYEGSYEFTSQTVRPMVLTSTAQSGDGKDYHTEHHASLMFLVLVDDYNPAPQGAEIFTIDGEKYFATADGGATLVGTNHRKAELDITKIINDTTGKSEADLLKETFTYRVTLVVPKDADLSLITGYEYVQRPDPNITVHGYQEGDNPLPGDETRFRGLIFRWGTFSYGPNSTPLGQAFVDSGDGKTKTLTVDISLLGNEILRFTNLPTGTTYTIQEVYANYKRANLTSDAQTIPSYDVPSNLAEQGYEVTAIRTSATDAEVKQNSTSTATLTASIDTPNKRYYNQFTNRLTDSVDAELRGTKHLKGYAWSGENYYFRLAAGQATYSDGGDAEPATSPMPEAARGRSVFYLTETSGTADKSYSFGDIRYTRPGTYKYTIREVASTAVDAATLSGTTGENGIVYGPIENVTVTVVRENGQLVVQSITGDNTTMTTTDGKAVSNSTITNERLVGDLTVLKIGDSDTNNPLKDVKFELYETYIGPGEDGNVKAKNGITGEDIGTLTTGTDGKFVIQGLLPSTEGKTYYLVETDTADGYIPLTDPVQIKLISKDEAPYYEVEYTQTGYADNVKVQPDEDGVLTITVNNESGDELPMAGGPGTRAFLIAGLLIIAVSLGLMGVKKMRKSE